MSLVLVEYEVNDPSGLVYVSEEAIREAYEQGGRIAVAELLHELANDDVRVIAEVEDSTVDDVLFDLGLET